MLLRPYLVSEIRDSEGVVLKRFSSKVRRTVLQPEVAGQLVEVLTGVVREGGTGPKAALPGFSVAGKTGTAQKIDPKTRRYSTKDFISSFVGFVPSNDPRIVILVMVDSPRGEAWGSEVAAPVFKKIAERTLLYLDVRPDMRVPLLMAAR